MNVITEQIASTKPDVEKPANPKKPLIDTPKTPKPGQEILED